MFGGAKCLLFFTFFLSYCDGLRILVIGASGRVGTEVVNQLIRDDNEKNIRILLRNTKDTSKIGELLRDNVEIFEGDILDDAALLKATENVSVVIDVHGTKRFSKFSDIFKSTPTDLTHPYHVNYQGTLKLLKAMKTNNVEKIVRITGALVNRKPLLNPWISMFNILLSRSPKWHERSEIAIRNSGIKYTVLRPPGLRKEPPASQTGRHLFLENGDYAAKSTIGKISITDVSRLCVIASCNPAQLENSTAICVSLPGTGITSWEPLIPQIKPDSKIMVPSNHILASIIHGSMFLALVSTIATIVTKLAILLVSKMISLIKLVYPFS